MMEEGLLEKTGKSLDHWIKVVKDSKIEKHKAIINFLKSEHDFTYGFANFVAHKSKKSDAESIDNTDLIDGQFKGKESLRTIYEVFNTEVLKLGSDIQVVPKKTSVSFVRKRQFALFKPATKKRIDLGLKLPGKELTERLQNSGPFGTMCTHRVQVFELEEIDKELLDWIKEAYESAS